MVSDIFLAIEPQSQNIDQKALRIWQGCDLPNSIQLYGAMTGLHWVSGIVFVLKTKPDVKTQDVKTNTPRYSQLENHFKILNKVETILQMH